MEGIRTLVLLFTLASQSQRSFGHYPDKGTRSHYGYSYKENEKFVPAKKGENPSCLNDPKLTYCTNPDDYPEERIAWLLDARKFEESSFIMDESRDSYTFEARELPSKPYGPYKQSPPKPKSLPIGYLPPHPTLNPSNSGAPLTSKYGHTNKSPHYGTYTNTYYNNTRAFSRPASSSYMSYTPGIHNSIQSRPEYTRTHSVPLSIYPGADFKRNSYHGGGSQRSTYKDTRYHSVLPRVQPHNALIWWRNVGNAGRSNFRSKRQVISDDGPVETTLCATRFEFIMPRAARNVQGDWMYLVNLGERNENFTQLVRAEICLNDVCDGVCNVPPGSRAVCQQQYVQKRLVGLGADGRRLNQDVFWFPSCCVCKIRREF